MTWNSDPTVEGVCATAVELAAIKSEQTRVAESILKDKKKILPCAVYLEGEYGFNDLFIGVPVKLGANGVEEVIEITLTAEEKAALEKSADAVRELKELLKKLS